MYSIVLPIRNEDASLPQLFAEIEQTFRRKRYEVIAVDDASGYTDHFGKWEALRTGIARARGDVIITLDSDLQDDPRELPKLINTLNEGYDIVSGWRKDRQDDWYKITISQLGNSMISLFAHKKFYDLNAPMKVYRRKALMGLPREGSLLRFSLLFAHTLGYRTAEISVRHRRRLYGTSKFGLVKYFRILYDSLLIFFLFSGSGRITNITDESADTKVQDRSAS